VPSIEFAKRIADAFGVTLDYLAGEGTLSELDKKTNKRMQDIDSLKDDDKNHLFAIVDAFLRDATARKAYAS
jgi:transcriptional regulator with XRE-family HTH domain